MKQLKNLKSPWVMLLIGPPLSGKSTFIRNNPDIFKDSVIISRDQIVLDLHGSDDYNLAFKEVNQKLVDKTLRQKLEDHSRLGDNIVIDMTNLTSKRRRTNLSYFGDEYQKIGVIFTILGEKEYELRNIRRNEEENKWIPPHVIKNMISSYQTIDTSEGFNKVLTV
jgi:predicted kinase